MCYRLHKEDIPSTQLTFRWYVRSLPKTMSMFILSKGVSYFNKAYEEAQYLEKDLKRYPFNLFSPSILYDIEYVEDELNVLEIVQPDRKIKDLYNEVMSIKKERNIQNVVHDLKKIVFAFKIQYSLDTKRKLVANSNPNFCLSNGCRYDECFTSSLHCLEYQYETFAGNLNPNTSDLCSEQFVQTNFEHFLFSQFDHNNTTNNKN